MVIREVVSVREWSELIMKLFPVSRRAHSGRIPDDKLAQQLGYERIKLRELMNIMRRTYNTLRETTMKKIKLPKFLTTSMVMISPKTSTLMKNDNDERSSLMFW